MRLKWPSALTTNESEYRANIDGLNLFFGAVLGVVMATTDRLGARDFAVTLFVAATGVVTVLYVSSSRQRWIYAVLAAAFIWKLPTVLAELVTDPAGLPRHLQPTLAVWLAMVVFLEFLPRERPSPPKP